MIIGAATSAAEISAWASARPSISRPRVLTEARPDRAAPHAMIRVPMMRTTESGSSRNLRPNTLPAIGTRQAIRAEATRQCLAPVRPARSAVKQVELSGHHDQGEPDDTIPVASMSESSVAERTPCSLTASSSRRHRVRLHRSRLRPVPTARLPQTQRSEAEHTGALGEDEERAHASSPPIDTAMPPTSSGPSSWPIGRPTPRRRSGTAPGIG